MPSGHSTAARRTRFPESPGTQLQYLAKAYCQRECLAEIAFSGHTLQERSCKVERKWKERYPQKFRCRVVERMNTCDNIVRLARELRINRTLLYKWRYRLEGSQTKSEVSIRNSRESTLRREIDKLKRLLANKTLEVDFFRNALQKVEARRRNSGISGEQASTMPYETPLQGGLSVERMCQLGQVSRAGFYRYLRVRAPIEESMTVRSAIQGDCLATSAALRVSARRGGASPAWDDREPQAGRANDGERQPADDPKP